jgi:hypothetical protein
MIERVTSSRIGGLTLVAFLMLSCQRRSPQLEGRWVGTVKVDDDLFFVEAEFTDGWTGLLGTVDLQGTGRLTLSRAIQLSKDVFFEVKRGSQRLAFAGQFKGDSLIGSVRDSGRLQPFQLRRIAQVDPRLLQSYAGAYQLGSDRVLLVERCASGLGRDQLVYVNQETGARKALFPTSDGSFFFGPGFLLPEPAEGMVTFVRGPDGRSDHLVWDEFGSSARIADRIDVRQNDWRSQVRPAHADLHCHRLSG